MTDGDMPELDIDLSDIAEEVDLTPVLVRKLAWDTMPCSDVPDLLTALGLTHGTDEGMDIDHRSSHYRMSQVFPLEPYLRQLSKVLGVVLSTAMTEAAGLDLGEDSVKFAEQEEMVILAGSRAIIAQLMQSGFLTYGPGVAFVPVEDADV